MVTSHRESALRRPSNAAEKPRGVWRELMFTDEDQAVKLTRDPVAPAKRSDDAMKKVQSRTLDDGTPTHSFQTLMAELQGIVRNTCRTPGSAAYL